MSKKLASDFLTDTFSNLARFFAIVLSDANFCIMLAPNNFSRSSQLDFSKILIRICEKFASNSDESISKDAKFF